MLHSASLSTSRSAAGIRELTFDQVKMLRAFINKRVMNPDDVDDILQCTLLEALRSEHKFLSASKPQTWLCGIALNLVRNHFRRMYRHPYHESWDDLSPSEISNQSEGDTVGHQVDGLRQLARAVDAIGSLSSKMQTVIKVAVEMDGNYQQTATSLGIPIGTVRSRLSRAREQLKRQINPFA